MVKSSKGGWSSILTYLFLLFIAWSEFGSYFGGYVDEQYAVEKQLRETAQINMDLYISTPCKWLEVVAKDQTKDQKFVSEELSFEDMPFFIPAGVKVGKRNELITPGLDEILGEAIPAKFRDRIDTTGFEGHEGFDGCHVFGSIPVNMVRGELQITPKGFGLPHYGRAPIDEINFSHVINELSFGPFYPYIDNPLDNTARLAGEPFKTYNYYASVVPTIYRKLGASVHTSQYSLSEVEHTFSEKDRRIPGIFLTYNFEALTITVSDERISFFQFVVRLVAMLSFIVYTASWAFRLVDSALVLIFGSKWSLRYQGDNRNSHGILE